MSQSENASAPMDAELWSTLAYDARSVIWNIDARPLSDEQRQRLTTATVRLRDSDPARLATLHAPIGQRLADRRPQALTQQLF